MSKRTTVTLDDDVVAKLAGEAHRSGLPFRHVLNEALRRALSQPRKPRGSKPFKVRARDLGARPDLDFDNIEQLLDQVEGPFRK
jgi:hypothetical protein